MPNPLHDHLVAPLADREDTVLIDAAGAQMSGRALFATAMSLAAALASLGLKPGDRLAVQVEKTPQALALYLAAITAGVVFLPLNTAYTAEEVAYFVSDAEAALLVGDPGKAAALSEVALRHGARFETLDPSGRGSLVDLAQAGGRVLPAVRSGGDLAAILYTSGTTGRSKGAMLTHDNLMSNARALVEEWRFTADDVLLHALPVYHTHGLFVACNVVLLSGGSMIFLPGFKAAEVLKWLPKATSMMGVPTFYTRLLDTLEFTRALVGHVRLFTSGSAPLLAETHKLFEERTGHRILERYGMTETNMSTSNPYDGERRAAGTVGFPLPGVELKITDPETGNVVPQGEPGMIEVRGPNVFKGYWRMPEKTREELRPDGFFITGDIGVVDADGYVSIVGRQKDLIITGGLNVYPKEIELILDEQPGVLESAVVGVPHPDFGEAVVAAVVPLPGAQVDTDALMTAMGERLARFKQPKHIAQIAELPRNTMGKVQKNLVRRQFEALFARATR